METVQSFPDQLGRKIAESLANSEENTSEISLL